MIALAASSHANRSVLVVDSGGLSINATGLLDLNDNDAIVRNEALSAIRSLVTSGFSDGYWSGYGFASTSAGNLYNLTALGFASGYDLFGGTGSFDGVSVAAGDMVIKYTYYGDATLDGKVDIDDYGLIDYFSGTSSGATWLEGDFTYDGAVNIDDYSLIDYTNGFGTSGNSHPQL